MSEKETIYALRFKRDDKKLFKSTSGGCFWGLQKQ